MKIAVLLLVHINLEQVKRLLSVLQHENIDIFIHIDKKKRRAAFGPTRRSLFLVGRKRLLVMLFDEFDKRRWVGEGVRMVILPRLEDEFDLAAA